MERTLNFDGTEFTYCWWSGQKLKSTNDVPFAWDLETEAIPPYRELAEGEELKNVPTHPLIVPTPTIGMAFDGDSLVLIHPSQFKEFTQVHRNSVWCGHNVSFDFWCVQKHCNEITQELLWQVADRNGLRDTLILDLLLQLASGEYRHGAGRGGDDVKLYPTNLGTLATEWGCGELDKTDPYRLRFGEFKGLTAEQIDAHPESASFFAYALKDVVTTWRIYPKQRVKAIDWMKKAGWSPDPRQKTYEIRPDALEKWGPLSEAIQVKASLVLAEMSRTPLMIDQVRRAEMESESRARYDAALGVLLESDPNLIKRFKSKKKGNAVKTTAAAGLPQFDQKVLVSILESEAAHLNVDVLKSDGKLKGTSTSAKKWAHLADRSKFIEAWVGLEKEAKSLEFLAALNAPAVYSRYNLLMRTGRTSAGAHRVKGHQLVPSLNVQQMPRDDPNHAERSIRTLFKAPAGYKWFSCDYGYIEVRALAAVAKSMLGWSKMADVVAAHTLHGGLDPHQKMATTVLGVSDEEFKKLPKETQKHSRQQAKVCVFGFPGGLGVDKFVEFAAASYGVRFSKKEARECKKAWLDTYPEMKLYMGDRLTEALRWNAGNAKGPVLSWLQKKRLSDYLKSKKKLKLTDDEYDTFWGALEWVAWQRGDEQTIEDVENRKVTERVRKLVYYRACVLTGRVRNGTTYTMTVNTPFQSAAADGAKLALYKLMRMKFKLISFQHDEANVLVPVNQLRTAPKQIQQIMEKEMESVLGQGVPVRAEGNLADYWAKG